MLLPGVFRLRALFGSGWELAPDGNAKGKGACTGDWVSGVGVCEVLGGIVKGSLPVVDSPSRRKCTPAGRVLLGSAELIDILLLVW